MEESDQPLINEKQNQMLEMSIKEEIYSYIRKGFIHKVYSLLFVQLFLTFGFVVLANETKALKIFIMSHSILCLLIDFIPLIIAIFFLIKPEATKKVPLNYILLFIFSMSFGYTISYFTLKYSKYSVYFTMMLTLIIVLVLSVYAFVTKNDFTMLGGILFSCLIMLIIASFLIYIFRLRILVGILNILGLILFTVYLIYDTQLIVGNKQRRLSEDDYILGVMILYLDIINIFIYLLQICGRKS